MGQSKLPPGFVYDRPVPQRWAEELATLAPKTDHTPWLLLTWLSGDPWEVGRLPDGSSQFGVQRWAVYEMVPLRVWWGLIQAQRQRHVPDDEIMELYVLQHLEGQNPRELGHYDNVLRRYVTEAEVTRQEWDLFRAHKAIPKLFWIIQGKGGGHKRTFTSLEAKYLRLAGLPDEPPAPGSLPYADFDQRTLYQLARRDRLHRMAGHLSPVESERDAQFVEFRRQLVQWLEDQQRAALEEQKLDLSGIPTSGAKEDDPTGHIEAAIDRFIQTGSSDSQPE